MASTLKIRKQALGLDPSEHCIWSIADHEPATLEWIAQDYVAHLKHHLNQVLGQTFETSYGK